MDIVHFKVETDEEGHLCGRIVLFTDKLNDTGRLSKIRYYSQETAKESFFLLDREIVFSKNVIELITRRIEASGLPAKRIRDDDYTLEIIDFEPFHFISHAPKPIECLWSIYMAMYTSLLVAENVLNEAIFLEYSIDYWRNFNLINARITHEKILKELDALKKDFYYF